MGVASTEGAVVVFADDFLGVFDDDTGCTASDFRFPVDIFLEFGIITTYNNGLRQVDQTNIHNLSYNDGPVADGMLR